MTFKRRREQAREAFGLTLTQSRLGNGEDNKVSDVSITRVNSMKFLLHFLELSILPRLV